MPEENNTKKRKYRNSWAEMEWKDRKQRVKPNVQAALDANDMEALADALPPLQKAFAEEYIKDFNGSQAVQRCGSTCETPNNMAYIWLSNPGVKAYINHLTAERTAQMKIDQGYVVQKLLRAVERTEGKNDSATLRALELLARHLGMLTDKQEITGKDGEAIKLEKVQNDADALASAIAGLVKRGGTDGVAEDTKH